jgi:hypothetical protein
LLRRLTQQRHDLLDAGGAFRGLTWPYPRPSPAPGHEATIIAVEAPYLSYDAGTLPHQQPSRKMRSTSRIRPVGGCCGPMSLYSRVRRLLGSVPMDDTHKHLLLYIAKCVAAVSFISCLSSLLRYPDLGWCLVSAVLVLSPDAKEALPVALTRIAANLVGSAAIFLCLLAGLPTVVTLSLAYGLAIAACFLFHLMNASRTALVAVTIIMLHPSEAHVWDNALERVLSVVTGCIVALVITLAFHRRWSEPSNDAPGDHAKCSTCRRG